jgi:hypothetical protein
MFFPFPVSTRLKWNGEKTCHEKQFLPPLLRDVQSTTPSSKKKKTITRLLTDFFYSRDASLPSFFERSKGEAIQ